MKQSYICIFFQLSLLQSLCVQALVVNVGHLKIGRHYAAKTRIDTEVKLDKFESLWNEKLCDEWEIDCYSRPILGDDGKKLWELLLTDKMGSFRYLETIQSNAVNSRNVRKIVEEIVENAPVRPKIIRFFRNQMFNMLTIALTNMGVEVKPSRCTTALCTWILERDLHVYPFMKGYNAQLKQQSILDYDVNSPDKLPDVLKAESFAFCALPAEAFWDEQINKENIGKGYLCPMQHLPKSGWIHGLSLYSRRSPSVAAWMSGIELSAVTVNLLTQEILFNTDINSQLLLTPLQEIQKREGVLFEKGKADAQGYHFLSIQSDPQTEEVDGFWLLRQFYDPL